MNVASLTTSRASLTVTFLLSLVAATPAQADSLTLLWDPSVDPVVGYAVYVGAQSSSLTQRHDVGNTTTFTMTNAVAGQQYCFAVAAYSSLTAEGPKSATVCGFSDQVPTLANPGNRTSTVGQAVTLQLVGSDPDGLPVSYSAAGLPPGVTLMSGTGFVSGAGTTAGTYSVTASVSDGVLSSSPVSFTWTVTASSSSDSSAPTVTIASPTSASSFTSSGSTLTLSGSAADNVGVTSVTWASDRGGSGTATGAASWSVSSIGLQVGANVITVRARDAAGNQGTDVLTVTYTPPDATLPTVTIASPTTLSSFATTSSSLAISGTATDDVGVTQVRWVNSRGGDGTASGTTSWSAPVVALQGGTNIITVTARDAAGNQSTDVLTVTYSLPDASAPTVSILGPTSVSTYSTASSVVTLGGTASDDQGVTAVTWTNDRGGSGFSSGTTSWSIPSVSLQGGANVITVTAQDAAGNKSADVLTVTYTAPPSSIVLSGSLYSSGRWVRASLTWTLVSGRYVDVYRNGVRVTRTSNDGSHTDGPKGDGPFSYRVCVSGTSVCSNTITLTRGQ